VGALGYFLVTGKPLFEAATVAEAFGHHLHSEPIPPSQRLGRAVPADLESLLLRCLRKRMDERPASAHEMGRALDQCAVTSPWTRQQAEAWWRSFRDANDAPAVDPTLAVTVTVDLGARARPLR
jgi:hypothetical protein